MRISIITAVSDNGIIGKDNKLPWNIPADLKRFKYITSGHHIIMGRKTYESMGHALPNRTNIVLTRNDKLKIDEGVMLIHSLDVALNIAKSAGETECFIIGGENLYKEAIPVTDRIYMTTVHAEIDGDTKFPVFNINDWNITEKIDNLADSKNPYNYSFLILNRK
jgi:dihydrofolate reductase